MLTARSLLYGGFSLTETPLDRDPSLDKDPPTLNRDPSALDRDPLDRDPPGQRSPPPPVDRQTPVKTLPSQTSYVGGNKDLLREIYNLSITNYRRLNHCIVWMSQCQCKIVRNKYTDTCELGHHVVIMRVDESIICAFWWWSVNYCRKKISVFCRICLIK